MLFIFAGLACDEPYEPEPPDMQPDRRVWYVHPDSAIKTIQAGLDSCVNGDTVIVSTGIYHEHIVWPNVTDICLLSETWPEQTVIDGDSAGRVITIDHPVTARIVGFTIRNGFAWEDGAGIYCDTSCQVRLDWIIADSNYINNGGAIYGGKNTVLIIEYTWILDNAGCGFYGDRADVVFYDCNIRGNHNDGYRGAGGGIWCNGGSLVAVNCDITDNSVGGMYSCYAAGIVCDHVAAQYVNCLISRNFNQTQFGRGGGIAVVNTLNQNSATVSIDDNTRIIGNRADYGGGIFCSDGQIVTIESSAIDSNSSYQNGAGIYSESAELTVTGCHIRHNHGDGICVARDSATINNCDISGNSGYGVVNLDAGHIVDAENNWWGDASGPSGVGPGSGDSVSAGVDYDPWKTRP